MENEDEKNADKLFRQILIFENHAHDNFEQMDSQMENIVGVWDGKFKLF
jgi:hypothetical protein